MKSYHKRLLTVVLSVALLLALSSAFITSAFHVDAAQLNLQPAGDVRSLAFVGRSDGELPSRDEIDADGYDAVLTDGFELALQSAAAALYFNKQTAEIALMDANTGHIWYSNPQDRDRETMVEGTTRKRLGAQVTVVEFLDKVGAGMDAEVATAFQRGLTKQGMTFRMGTKVTGATSTKDGVELTIERREGLDWPNAAL